MSTGSLNIAAIQTSLHWEDKTKNIHMFTGKLRAYSEPADVFVLPEMFTTGFSMRSELLAEELNGPTHQWMIAMAKEKNAAITGSIIAKDGGGYYNRMLWVNPDGTTSYYDKRHLFRMAQEDRHYASGTKRMIVDFKGWRICLHVCYDLRFPVWSRNRYRNESGIPEAEYDVLVYVANWPERRNHAWKTLLMARAIENSAYVIGVNRIGNDANGIYHSGDSAILNFKGEIIKAGIISADEIINGRLSMQELQDYRKSFPVGMDADSFIIQ
jgi:predicted amidohydrolase